MDDLLRQFSTETNASLDAADNQLVGFEQAPNTAKILNLDLRLAKMAAGVGRLGGQLMVVLDVDRFPEIAPDKAAA